MIELKSIYRIHWRQLFSGLHSLIEFLRNSLIINLPGSVTIEKRVIGVPWDRIYRAQATRF